MNMIDGDVMAQSGVYIPLLRISEGSILLTNKKNPLSLGYKKP